MNFQQESTFCPDWQSLSAIIHAGVKAQTHRSRMHFGGMYAMGWSVWSLLCSRVLYLNVESNPVCLGVTHLLQTQLSGCTCREAVIAAGAIPPLVRLLEGHSAGLQRQAVRILLLIVAGDKASQAAAVSAGALPALVCLLGSGNEECQENAARAIQGIVQGSNEYRYGHHQVVE